MTYQDELATTSEAELLAENPADLNEDNIWETLAKMIVNVDDEPSRMADFVQWVSVLRVGVPSLVAATGAKIIYPSAALWLAAVINDPGAFAVISQDSSQYIQNILTTSGLAFSILVGQTYYFMYQQQEAIYLALYEEVTMAKSLLEQLGLVSQGRPDLYERMLECMDLYIREDLQRFNDVEPAVMLSARPVDDPLEDILYLTSVGEPSVVYQTVRSLRQARAHRLGALQRKLPSIHMTLLWTLAAIVLCSFPLLGAGVQTIGGMGILIVQSYYLGIIVFGICLVMGVVYELQMPAESGAYNARTVLQVMVAGLEEELRMRMNGEFVPNMAGPSLDIQYAGVLPLATAEEILQQTPVVSSSSKAAALQSTSVEVQIPTANKQEKMERKGLRSKVKNWASNVFQSSLTKYK